MSLKLFSGDGSGLVRFSYPQNRLILKASGGVSISFDNGQTYMDLTDGSYNWNVGMVKQVRFGPGGSWEIFAPRDSFSTGVLVFNPSKISGLTGWWSSDNIDGLNNSTLTDLDFITQWNDLSGNDYHLETPLSRAPRYYEAADSQLTPSKPAVYFSKEGGIARHLTVPSSTAGFDDILPQSGKSIYTVHDHKNNPGPATTPGLGPKLLGTDTYPTNFAIDYGRYQNAGGGSQLEWDLVWAQNATYIDAVNLIQPYVTPDLPGILGKVAFSFRHDGSNYAMRSYNPVYINDPFQIKTGTAGTPNTGSDEFALAWQYDFINEHQVDIYEVVTFDNYLSDEDDAQMITYLTEKWGLGVD